MPVLEDLQSTSAHAAHTPRTTYAKRSRLPLLAGLGAVLAATPAFAENWRLGASVSATETYTSNANFGVLDVAQGDWVTSLSGTLTINGVGPRARLVGSIAATGTLYAGQNQNNSLSPQVNLAGNVEAIEKLLWIDATANVNQTFYSPLGAQPGSLVNATANRYTSQTYSLSPYIQGRFGGTTISYQLRDDNYWSIASQFGDSSLNLGNTFTNHLHGSVSSPAAPLGWELTYDGTYFGPSGGDFYSGARVQDHYTTQIARVILPYQIDPQLQISPRIGYEKNQFTLTSSEDVTYGAGLQWSPTERTQVGGFWEERFYGSSYSAQISHRLPKVALSANFSRGLNTTPQSALSIPAGANVEAFVDAAFTSRIPDPAERALAVQQFLAKSGLPATLATPVNIFATNIQLQDSGNVSMVLIGVRNSLAFNVFYLQTNAISGTGEVLPQVFQRGQNTTQTGGGVSYSHQLSGMTNLTASATYSRSKSNATEGALVGAESVNTYLNLGASTQFGPKTSASAGVSYSHFDPTASVNTSSSSSVNIFASISHSF